MLKLYIRCKWEKVLCGVYYNKVCWLGFWMISSSMLFTNRFDQCFSSQSKQVIGVHYYGVLFPALCFSPVWSAVSCISRIFFIMQQLPAGEGEGYAVLHLRHVTLTEYHLTEVVLMLHHRAA